MHDLIHTVRYRTVNTYGNILVILDPDFQKIHSGPATSRAFLIGRAYRMLLSKESVEKMTFTM